ncbi:MAG: ABC transporter substrate-binding protein, partial [Pseudomonadota bacterium]|nr:ABC transporter substrate-binding protein [Pseudomonadota bacterium]
SAPGIGFNRGVAYAASKLNAAGGVKGRKIEVVTRDTQGDPTKAVNAAVEMASRVKVIAVFGPTNSGEALATTPLLARFKVPNMQVGVVDTLINPQKYPNAFRVASDNSQWDAANRNYCLNVLKARSVAVLGDNTGYGTTAVGAAVENFKKSGANVVYHAVIDANAQDVSPDLLRARNAGAQVVVVWSDSTGLDARMMNARARIGWDVVFAGHPAMGSGGVAHLLDKPANWEKVYIVGYKSCSFDASGKLPARTQAFVEEVKGKIELADTSLWWVVSGVDAVNLLADAVEKTGSSSSEAIIGYWNTLKGWPGLFGDYTYTPTQHNGYPTDEVVMSAANSERNGAFALAPGYS